MVLMNVASSKPQRRFRARQGKRSEEIKSRQKCYSKREKSSSNSNSNDMLDLKQEKTIMMDHVIRHLNPTK